MKKVILLSLILVLNSCVVIKYDCTCKPIEKNRGAYIIKDNPNIILNGTTTLNDSLIKKYQWHSDRFLTNKNK